MNERKNDHPTTSSGRADGANAAPASGTTLAIIKGQSSRAVLANTVRDIGRVPAFMASYFRHRDPRSWVFGNVHGYRDSPRYLAEHIVHSRPDITAHWIAHSQAEADEARAAGLNVALRGHPDAIRIQRHAGAAFFTHGFRDLDLPSLSSAFIVFLWHGTPLKRIALDVKISQSRRPSVAVRAAAGVVRWAHSRAFQLVDLFVAAGELEQQRFVTAFATSPDRVKVLGSPRFDVIRGGAEYARLVDGDLRARLGYKPDDRVVLWLPTHRREYGDATWLPSVTGEEIDRAFAGTSLTLLAKPHPRADWDVFQERLPNHPRIKLLRAADVDVNCLLHIADALVSDYSSVVCDYVILERPVHFLAPDVNTYSDNRGLYDPYDTLTAGRHHRDWPSLLDALRGDFVGRESSEGIALARRLAEHCRLNTDPETCRRIVETVLDAVLAGSRAGKRSGRTHVPKA